MVKDYRCSQCDSSDFVLLSVDGDYVELECGACGWIVTLPLEKVKELVAFILEDERQAQGS